MSSSANSTRSPRFAGERTWRSAARPPGFAALAVTAVLAALVLGFYCWTGSSTGNAFIFPEGGSDYYNLLSHGFLDGHTYMKTDPHPDLFSPDPVVRSHAPYLLDASLYQKRYYLYFGAAPVVTLILPWRLLAGCDMPENLATVLFGGAGFIWSLGLLWSLRRRRFASAGMFPWLGVVVAAGLSTVVPIALRRGAFYEMAVCCAYAFAMLFFLAAWQALVARTRRHLWLALASLAYGLIVASRPNLAFSGILLPVLAGLVWRAQPGPEPRLPELIRCLLAAGLPAAFCLLGLFGYNYARFGSPFDFGHLYQTGSNAAGLKFTAANLWHNLRLYYFTVPEFSRYFPFFSPGAEGPRPAGYFGIEHVHGQIYGAALLAVAVVAGAARSVRRRGGAPVLILALGLLAWFLGNGALMAAATIRSDRYSIDFHPELILLAAIATLALASAPARWARLLAFLAAATFCLSGFYNAMVSMKTQELFQEANHPGYNAIAHVFNYPSFWYQRARGERVGALQLSVTFRAQPPGTLEPLLSTGAPLYSDVLYVRHEGGGSVSFLFEHFNHGIVTSLPVPIEYGRAYAMEIGLGSLYPPEPHPFFDTLARGQMRLLKRTATISLDGKPVFRGSSAFYDASPGQVYIGENHLRPTAMTGRFSGEVVELGRQPLAMERLIGQAQTEVGPVAFRLTFPLGRSGAEPLVTTGVNGQADVLFVEYIDEHHLRFGLDHWGGRLVYSPILFCDYRLPHDVEVGLGSLYPADLPVDPALRQQLVVRLDGHEIMATRMTFHRSDRLAVDLGCNSIGASSCRMFFGGQIIESKRLGVPARASASPTEPASLHALVLKFPDQAAGRTQPILTLLDAAGKTGTLCARYGAGGTIQFGLLHGAGETPDFSEPLPLDYTRAHAFVVGMSGPAASVLADAPLALYWQSRRPQGVWLALDGRQVFFRDFPAQSLGSWGNFPATAGGAACDPLFTGVMEIDPPADQATPTLQALPAVPTGPLEVSLRFPSQRTGHHEPLLTTGITGGGDAVYVEYLDEGQVRFGFDHWGAGGPESPAIPLDYAATHRVTISFGSFFPEKSPERQRLWIELDSRRIWTALVNFHPIPPGKWQVGSNPIHLSTCEALFQGEILGVTAAAPAAP